MQDSRRIVHHAKREELDRRVVRLRRRGVVAAGVRAKPWLVSVLILVLAVLPAAAAEPNSDEPTLLDGWTFEVDPYLWIPVVQGTLSADGRTARVDVGFDDIFDLIGDDLSLLAGMAHVEAHHGRFSGFLDFTGIKVDTDESATLEKVESTQFPGISTTAIDTKVQLKQDQIFFEFGAAYRVLTLPLPARTRPFTLEALVGGRYMYYWTSISAKASTSIVGLPGGPQAVERAVSTHKTIDWVDPFIGTRFGVPLTDDIELGGRGDIGGFGAGSDLAWSLVGDLRYALPWHPFDSTSWLTLGYKVLAFDYEDGGNRLDFQYRGPAAGLRFVF